MDRETVQGLLPHQGKMCLIDSVLSWNEHQIICQSDNHRDPDHPLRLGKKLSALHAFEYGAQAAAVHGGLCARQNGEKIKPGYLGAFRNGQLYIDYLNDIKDSLLIRALIHLRGADSMVYDTEVEASGRLLAAVRITVFLQQVE